MGIEYYEVDLAKVLEILKSFFKEYGRADLVILYGSVVRRRFVRDIDLLVYGRNRFDLKELSKIASELEERLGVPVDIVPLNSAYPQVVVKAILEGIMVVVRDKKVLVDIYKKALGEVMDMEIKLNMSRSK